MNRELKMFIFFIQKDYPFMFGKQGKQFGKEILQYDPGTNGPSEK
jgi:hypothetical protein